MKKKKLTLEELEKRIEALERGRTIFVPQYPYYPTGTQCTCNTSIFQPCPVHGYPNIVTC